MTDATRKPEPDPEPRKKAARRPDSEFEYLHHELWSLDERLEGLEKALFVLGASVFLFMLSSVAGDLRA